MAERLSLEQARRNENKWTLVETAIPVVMLLTSWIFEDLEIHEGLLAVLEGIAIWQRNHWAKQVENITAGRPTSRARITDIFGHVSEAQKRGAARRPATRAA